MPFKKCEREKERKIDGIVRRRGRKQQPGNTRCFIRAKKGEGKKKR